MQVEQPTTRYRETISNYEKHPFVRVSDDDADCTIGWESILAILDQQINAIEKSKKVIVIETYHGVRHQLVEEAISALKNDHFFSSRDLLKSDEAIDAELAPLLGDHPVFGFMGQIELSHYFDQEKIAKTKATIDRIQAGTVILYGPGASLLVPDHDLLIYADMARWEIQLRMRAGEIANLGVQNHGASTAEKYKRAYFADWRACDRHKQLLMARWDYLLDTHDDEIPKLVSGSLIRKAMQLCTERPIRLVPLFDPGVWGGQWMKEVCALPEDAPNYAWCFDCVPEENSLLLAFGKNKIEIPSINLVFMHPELLLGAGVFAKFGAEFPIRFDFLDTMEGGNLSLQVHPIQSYMKEHFGLSYTQDESYYLLEAGPDAVVYLGQKEGIDPDEMMADLELAQESDVPFPADNYVEKWSVKKHDHILIPAGTVHCSGKDSMVLEISATPYIFTFKLWDWGRLDLDGKPRPISLEHGREVIEWDRTATWVKEELINRSEPIGKGPGWREECTGLHELEFISTRRHWFTDVVHHDTAGNLNVLNLVEGDEVIVESPTGDFEPMIIHYAETFIVPAAVGPYTIRPTNPDPNVEYATVKAFVRLEES